MKAHLFREGGGMVTGTHDKKLARKLIADLKIDGDNDREFIAQVSREFSVRSAELETGRIVPVGPNTPDAADGYFWFWRSGYELGKPGVTKAVVWHG